MQDIAVLKRFSIFKDLNDRETEVIANIAVRKTYEAGTRIFEEKGLATALFLILDGGVAIKMHSKEMNIQIDELKTGDIFGWSSVIDPYAFTASAWALVKTEVLVLPVAELNPIFRNNNHIGYRVIKEIAVIASRRLKAIEAKFVEYLEEENRKS